MCKRERVQKRERKIEATEREREKKGGKSRKGRGYDCVT